MHDQRHGAVPERLLLIYQSALSLGQLWADYVRAQDPRCRVLRTANLRQAQEWLRDEPVDLCALDLMGAEDVDLFFDLRMALPGVKTLLTAVRPPTKIAQDLAQTGATIQYVDPSFSPAQFYAALKQTVDWGRDERREAEPLLRALSVVPRLTNRISGNLKVLLPDLVQLKCLTGSTCVLEISAGLDVGEIFFERGNIVHGCTSELEGVAALVAIFDWQNCRFDVLAWREPSVRSIRDRWESLLLEVTRLVDEAKHRAEEPPSHSLLVAGQAVA